MNIERQTSAFILEKLQGAASNDGDDGHDDDDAGLPPRE